MTQEKRVIFFFFSGVMQYIDRLFNGVFIYLIFLIRTEYVADSALWQGLRFV